MLLGNRKLDLVSIIKQQRIKDGRATGITTEELKKTAHISSQATVDKAESSVVGPFSDLTSIMRRSDNEEKDRIFVDDSEHKQNEQEIKETFLLKASSFEELLATMGLVKPGNEGKITYEDFNKVVSHYCGRTKFSSF